MRKCLKQTAMLPNQANLEALILVLAFIHIYALCIRAAKVQVSLHIPEPSLLDDMMSKNLVL